MPFRSSAVAWGFIDGFSLVAASAKKVAAGILSVTEEKTGIGVSAREHAPTGMIEGKFEIEGALWDTTATTGSHAGLIDGAIPASPQATARVTCFGFSGTTGEPFYGGQASWQTEADVTAEHGALQKANVVLQVSGEMEEGVILQPLATKTADWDTESTPVDNAASSADGGSGYLQVIELDTFTAFDGAIHDSPDDVTYTELIDFTQVTSAPAAERVTVAGTVDRYLAFNGDVTGTPGQVQVFGGFHRN